MKTTTIKTLLGIAIGCAIGAPALFWADPFELQIGMCYVTGSLNYVIWPWGFFGFQTGFFGYYYQHYTSCGTGFYGTNVQLFATPITTALIASTIVIVTCVITLKSLPDQTLSTHAMTTTGIQLLLTGILLVIGTLIMSRSPIPSPAGAVYLVIGIMLYHETHPTQKKARNDPLALLKEKLASGEISEEEFARKKQLLQG